MMTVDPHQDGEKFLPTESHSVQRRDDDVPESRTGPRDAGMG